MKMSINTRAIGTMLTTAPEAPCTVGKRLNDQLLLRVPLLLADYPIPKLAQIG